MDKPALPPTFNLKDSAPILRLPGQGSPYSIKLPTTSHVVVTFGQKAGTARAEFTHPKVLAKFPTVHEFKHYGANGRKWWTSSNGVDIVFAIPAGAIEIIAEAGYSYVEASINGVRVTFNVSGGTSAGNGWTDWVNPTTSVAVGHSLRDMARIAEVAASAEELQQSGWTWGPESTPHRDEGREAIQFQAKECERLVRLREMNGGGSVVLVTDASHYAGERCKVESVTPNGAGLVVQGPNGGRVRIAANLIDWTATAKAGSYAADLRDLRPVRFHPPGSNAAAAA